MNGNLDKVLLQKFVDENEKHEGVKLSIKEIMHNVR